MTQSNKSPIKIRLAKTDNSRNGESNASPIAGKRSPFDGRSGTGLSHESTEHGARDNPDNVPTAAVDLKTIEELIKKSKPTYAKVDHGSHFRRLMLRISVVAILVASVLQLSENEEVIGMVTEVYSKFFAKKELQTPVTTSFRSKKSVSPRKQQIEFEATPCPKLSQIALNPNYAGMQNQIAVMQSECHLLSDDLSQAVDDLVSLNSAIKNDGPTLVDSSAITVFGEALTLEVFALLRMGKISDADALLTNRCQVWKATYGCVAKFSVLVSKGLTNAANTAYSKIKPEISEQSPRLQSLFFLAAARLASASGERGGALSLFDSAIEIAPTSRPALLLRIIEEKMLFMIKIGQFDRLASIAQRSEASFENENPQVLWKIQLLGELSDSKRARQSLLNFLSKESYVYRMRIDSQFISGIGPISIQYGMGDRYLRLVRSAYRYQQSLYKISPLQHIPLKIWEVRTLISFEQFEQALPVIQEVLTLDPKNALAHHLRGICLLNLSSHGKYQQLAAEAFQNAVSASQSWESQFGLGIAQLRNSKIREAFEAIELINRHSLTPQQKYWTTLLMAEYNLTTNRERQAIPLLQEILVASPDSYQGLKLLAQVFEKMGKKKESLQTQEKLDKLQTKVNYLNTPEGISSPLGPLSFNY